MTTPNRDPRECTCDGGPFKHGPEGLKEVQEAIAAQKQREQDTQQEE
jgi:hypothetical protein